MKMGLSPENDQQRVKKKKFELWAKGGAGIGFDALNLIFWDSEKVTP